MLNAEEERIKNFMFKKMRIRNWMIVISIVGFLIIGFNQLIVYSDISVIKTSEKKIQNNVESNIDRNLLSKFPGLHLDTRSKETETYTSFISVPTTNSDEINDTIESWLKKQESNFIDRVEENKEFLTDEFTAHLNIQLDTQIIANDIYSFVFTTYEMVGGANGSNKIKTFIIDLEDNKVLNIEDTFYTEKDETISSLQDLLKKELLDLENTTVIFEEEPEQLDAIVKDITQWKWALNKKHMRVFFDEYEIAAGSAGVIHVDIPIEDVLPHLNSKIAKKLNLEIDKTNEEIDRKKKEQEKKEEEKRRKEEQKRKEQEEKERKEREKEEQSKPKKDPNGKYVALTFDDGPSQSVTPRVLETLRKYDAKATFYMLGSQVDYYPSIAKMVVDEGHEVGSHTDNHLDLTTIGNETIYNELSKANQKIKAATGLDYIKTVRPPYGAYNQNIVNITSEYHSSIILWSVDSLDWQSRNAQAINEVILRDLKPGGIVLMHDIHSTTADALPQLLETLKNDGYQFITVSELLELKGVNGIGPHHGY